MKQFPRLTIARLKSYQRLAQKKHRQEEGRFLLEGVHLISEALSAQWKVECVMVTSEFAANPEHATLLRGASEQTDVCTISDTELKKLSDTVTAQGIIAVAEIKSYSLSDFWPTLPKRCLLVALEDVSDPGNLGSILRTCDWFGVDGVFIDRKSVDLYNPKVVRATMGSLFHLPVLHDIDLEDMMHRAKATQVQVIATALDGGNLFDNSERAERRIVLFGNEARGISDSVKGAADQVITIPRFGRAESLNVAVACGVVLGALRSQLQ